MESSRPSMVEFFKLGIFSAGVPLAVSAVGFIFSRSLSKKAVDDANTFETVVEEDEEEVGDRVDHAREVLDMRRRLKELQERELNLEKEFLCYEELKEKEAVLMENRNLMILETARVEFLEKEVSSMEVENRRIQNFAVENLRCRAQLEHLKQENELIRRKMEKLLGKSEKQLCLLKDWNFKIKVTEEEIVTTTDLIGKWSNVVKNLKNEVMELHALRNELQDEKSALMKDLNSSEVISSSISQVPEIHSHTSFAFA